MTKNETAILCFLSTLSSAVQTETNSPIIRQAIKEAWDKLLDDFRKHEGIGK